MGQTEQAEGYNKESTVTSIHFVFKSKTMNGTSSIFVALTELPEKVRKSSYFKVRFGSESNYELELTQIHGWGSGGVADLTMHGVD